MWLTNIKETIYQLQVLPCFALDYEDYNINLDVQIPNDRNLGTPEVISSTFLEDLNTKWKGFEHIYTD